jgi:hypothetical protein
VRRGLIFWRLVSVVLLVGAVSASAYAVGQATSKDHADLEKVLAAADKRSQRAAVRSSAASQAQSRSSERRQSTHARPKTASPNAPAKKVDRGSIVVAVLNATTVSGLARGMSEKLAAAGFAPGLAADDSRARATTTVLYAAGNRPQGHEVAKVVEVGRAHVRPMDATTRSLVGGQAKVVITVGSDRARPQGDAGG